MSSHSPSEPNRGELRPRNGRNGLSGRHQRKAIRIKPNGTSNQSSPSNTPPSERLRVSKTPSPEPVPDPNVQANKVFAELLATERTYVHRLEILQEIRKRINQRTEHLKNDTKEQISNTFDPPGLQAIMTLHKNEILPKLNERGRTELCFGAIFSDKYIAPYFKVYAEFLSRKNIFDSRIQKLRQNQHVGPQLQKVEAEDIPNLLQGNKLSLNTLLLEPVQRLPRYELFLREYLKRLPANHLDREPALKALRIIQDANKRNNLKMAEAENQGKLAKLAKNISGMTDDKDREIVDGSRTLIFHGSCYKMPQRASKPKKVEFLVLSDMVIVVYEKHIGRGKEAKHKMLLKGLDYELMEMPLIGKNLSDIKTVQGLRLSSVTETIDLIDFNDDQGSVREIHRQIESQMKDFQLNLETFRKTPEDTDAQQSDEKKFPFGQRAPRMVHESDVSQCMKCWKSFGFGSSKHHCKSCGIVICSQCGAYQTVLEYSKSQLQVCAACYAFSKRIHGQIEEPTLPDLFDDLWRKSFIQGYLRVRQANDSEFHKSWCAIIPSWGSEGWIFTARKAPCDTSSIYEKPLNNCSFDPVVTHNQREWNLTLGNERFYILLEDNSTRNDWVTHMRQGIKMSSQVSSQSALNGSSRSNNKIPIRVLSRSETATNILTRAPPSGFRATLPSDGTKEMLKKPFYFI